MPLKYGRWGWIAGLLCLHYRMAQTSWLWNVISHQQFYLLFFRVVELATQAFLPNHLHSSKSSTKSLQDKVIADEDVQFYCSVVSVNLQHEPSSKLLHYITELWVKMRGFALTSARMEAYKRASQKNTKGKKGLRKQLHSPVPDHNIHDSIYH